MGVSLTSGAAAEQDVESRLGWLWHALFAATLAMPTVIALTSDQLGSGEKVLVAALAGLLGLGHWLVVARHPEWWERRRGRLGLYWAAVCAAVAVLASLSSAYTLALYGLFPMMVITLGWWGVLPIVALTALQGVALGGWGSGQAMVTNLLATAGLAVLVTAFVSAVARQSEQRREALAALASTREELAVAATAAGVTAERERLARELHDTVAQGFISVVTQLEAAERALASGANVEAHERIAKAAGTARTSLDELRHSVHALRPDLLESGSLVDALQATTQRWGDETRVPVELRATGEPVPLHPDTELAVLRAVQESLANISRHARASRVVVSLSYLGDLVTLDVDDDGVGFIPDAIPTTGDGGFGLVAMRERVAAVGGEVAVESAPGQGTTLAISVPA